jgi:hypothetical protein
LKDETIITGPWKAVVSRERSSFFGSSAPVRERTTVRSSGREMACLALPAISIRANPPCCANLTSAILARAASVAVVVVDVVVVVDEAALAFATCAFAGTTAMPPFTRRTS